MKRIKLMLVALLMFGMMGISWARRDANWQLVIDSAAVAGTAVIYSEALMIGPYSDLSFLFTVHTDTVTTDVKLEVQVLDSNGSDFDVLGSTNDVSVDPNYDTSYSTNNYAMGWTDLITNGTLVASQSSGKACDGFSMPVTRWMRFKITGGATNEATSGRVRVSLTLGRYSEKL